MKTGGILNRELNLAIASMGHGDLMIVTDAGLAIPNEAWVIDLSLVPDVPDLKTVLSAIKEEMFVEKVAYAQELVDKKSPHLDLLAELFPGVETEVIPHAKIRDELTLKAKVIVRTGAYQPWGNTLLYSGVDLPAWMSKLEG